MPEPVVQIVPTAGSQVAVTHGGDGPPVLLLHGFPQTRLMWRDIAPTLAEGHHVVAADLRGYGDSGTPESDPEHAAYSKRAMAAEMVEVMATLGHDRFAIVGHDRGGRVAYRAALDHPDVITALVVLDVLPVDAVWDRADAHMALAFWPWSLLAQPTPLPEALLAEGSDAVVDSALGGDWGTPAATFDDEVRQAYRNALRDPAHVHAVCEEYRAGAGIDRDHDAADRVAGRTIRCPTLALWSATGALGTWYDDLGGPLALWRELAPTARGRAVDGGHFFPEEYPDETARAIAVFLAER